MAYLELVREPGGGDLGGVVPLAGEVVFGRYDPAEADVVVCPCHPTVSRLHARIDRLPDGRFAVTDLDSRNGTYPNRRRCEPGQPVPLADGDQLRLAEHVYVYHDGDPDPAARRIGFTRPPAGPATRPG